MKLLNLNINQFINHVIFYYRCVQQVAGRYAKYSFPVDDYSNCLPLYNEICRRLSALSVVSSEHLLASGQSSLTQTMAFIALLNGRKDWTLELSNEMTQLLSSINDVESAGVPVELKVIQFYSLKIVQNCAEIVF